MKPAEPVAFSIAQKIPAINRYQGDEDFNNHAVGAAAEGGATIGNVASVPRPHHHHCIEVEHGPAACQSDEVHMDDQVLTDTQHDICPRPSRLQDVP